MFKLILESSLLVALVNFYVTYLLDEINCYQSTPQVEQPSTNLEIIPTPNAESAPAQSVSTPTVVSNFYI